MNKNKDVLVLDSAPGHLRFAWKSTTYLPRWRPTTV